MERIRQLRKERGLSQARLAVMADMDPATLNRLERGTGNPNLKTLERVAQALGVEVADFFPKAQRRSSLEPSLLNGLEEERLSRFAEAIVAAAERWGLAMSRPETTDSKRLGFIDAALTLSDVINERVEAEEWATPNQERLEILTTLHKLREAAEQGVRHLEESGEAKEGEAKEAQEEQVAQRRQQIRELTRRISA